MSEVVNWLYMEELARTQALNREWHAASAAALRVCVDKFCSAIWKFPQLMQDKWDNSLKRLPDSGGREQIHFKNSRARIHVHVRINVKPLTGSSLRDGTNHLLNFGVRDEARP